MGRKWRPACVPTGFDLDIHKAKTLHRQIPMLLSCILFCEQDGPDEAIECGKVFAEDVPRPANIAGRSGGASVASPLPPGAGFGGQASYFEMLSSYPVIFFRVHAKPWSFWKCRCDLCVCWRTQPHTDAVDASDAKLLWVRPFEAVLLTLGML